MSAGDVTNSAGDVSNSSALFQWSLIRLHHGLHFVSSGDINIDLSRLSFHDVTSD